MEFDISCLSDIRGKDYSRQGLMILEGRFLIDKALSTGTEAVGLVCSEDRAEEWKGIAAGRFPVVAMTHDEICSLVGFAFHRGEILVAARPAPTPVSALLERRAAAACAAEPRYLCLWDVTDPSNVGGLLRSAAALGASGILLGPGTADPFYRKSLRASMGNALSLPLTYVSAGDLPKLRAAGFCLAAAVLSPGSVPLDDVRPRYPLVLLAGNEGYGLPAEVIAECDLRVKIPMSNDVDSLNVGVAAGICMYRLFGARG